MYDEAFTTACNFILPLWYGLGYFDVEERVHDSLPFMQFVELQLEDEVPDHSLIKRFRTEMTKQDAYEKIFEQLNEPLEAKGLIVKTGALVVRFEHLQNQQ